MKNARRIVIVGGVAGGASAAAKARRVDETSTSRFLSAALTSPLPTAACRISSPAKLTTALN